MSRTMAQQIATLDAIRERVLADTSKLKMSEWHSECGTAHCIAGWAQVLNTEPLPQHVEASSAGGVGGFLLPDFERFFYGDNDRTLVYLRSRAYKLKHGEVVYDEEIGCWVDSGCNYYDAALSAEQASAQAATNNYCRYCTGCTDCTHCTHCTDCAGCTVCAGLTGCIGAHLRIEAPQ